MMEYYARTGVMEGDAEHFMLGGIGGLICKCFASHLTSAMSSRFQDKNRKLYRIGTTTLKTQVGNPQHKLYQ